MHRNAVTAATKIRDDPLQKKRKEIQDYINSIDISTVRDRSTIRTIFKEIGDEGYFLATNPFTSESLERLVSASDSGTLVPFLNTICPRACYTKLGSRIVEATLRRLFECLYVQRETFSLKEVVAKMDLEKCLNSKDGAHVMREVICLLSGKKVRGLTVEKYNSHQIPPSSDSQSNSANAEDAKEELLKYKQVFSELIDKKAECFENDDAWGTLAVFIQCTKSQSLIAKLIRTYAQLEEIQRRGFFYEVIPGVSNRQNMDEMYARIKDDLLQLTVTPSSSYFVKQFVLYYKKPLKVFRKFPFNEVESNSNVVLALLESLLRHGYYEQASVIVHNFYNLSDQIFYELLLRRYDGIDTKFVGVITELMGSPSTRNYDVNRDFVRHFSKEWLRSSAGIKLVTGFLNGTADAAEKQDFVEDNIDAFWNCPSWREGKVIAKLLTKYATGHSRKKAFEMLHKCMESQ